MLTVLRQRNFGLLWWGGLISMIGDWMLRIALPLYIYEQTGSTLATGIMFMVGALPPLLLGSVAGVFVDRWNRQRTMVITNLLLMLGLLPLVLVQSAEGLWIVYTVAFVQGCISQFFGPAENALLPTLVAEEQLMTANSLNALNNNLARLIGPALGGLLAAQVGLVGIALLDALTFAIAAAMIALIYLPPRPAPEREVVTGEAAWATVWREWLAGLALVRGNRLLTVLFVIIALWAVGEGIFTVLYIPFVTEVLKGGTLELGWLMSAQAIGGLIGGVVIAKVGERIPAHRLLGPSAVLFGLIDLAIFNYSRWFPGFTLAIVLFILVGIPGAGGSTSLMTLLQTSVSDAYRGRIFGAFVTTFSLVTLITMAIASTLGDWIGTVTLINVQGYAQVLSGLVATVFFFNQTSKPDEVVLSPSK